MPGECRQELEADLREVRQALGQLRDAIGALCTADAAMDRELQQLQARCDSLDRHVRRETGSLSTRQEQTRAEIRELVAAVATLQEAMRQPSTAETTGEPPVPSWLPSTPSILALVLALLMAAGTLVLGIYHDRQTATVTPPATPDLLPR